MQRKPLHYALRATQTRLNVKKCSAMIYENEAYLHQEELVQYLRVLRVSHPFQRFAKMKVRRTVWRG
jgi:hypothetical protein